MYQVSIHDTVSLSPGGLPESRIIRGVARRTLGIRSVELPDLDRPVVPTPDRKTSRCEFVKNRVEPCFRLCDVHQFSQLLNLVSLLRFPRKDVDQLIGYLLAAGRLSAPGRFTLKRPGDT